MPRSLKQLAKDLPGIRDLLAERDDLRRDRYWLLAERYAARASLRRISEERDRLLEHLATGTAKPPAAPAGHLFIVTYGRSGSTLLQGVLNSIPGYLIRGENRQVPLRLLQLHLSALQDQEHVRSELRLKEFEHATADWTLGMPVPDPALGPLPASNATQAWFGIEGYDEDVAVEGFRRLLYDTVLRPADDTRVLGFKEVRWPSEHLADYLEFLRQVFPNSRFVINTRDLDGVLRSKWWADDPDAARKLRQAEDALLRAAADLGADAMHVRYDDWKSSPGALRPLFDWLGEELDERAVAGVLGTPHSY